MFRQSKKPIRLKKYVFCSLFSKSILIFENKIGTLIYSILPIFKKSDVFIPFLLDHWIKVYCSKLHWFYYKFENKFKYPHRLNKAQHDVVMTYHRFQV